TFFLQRCRKLVLARGQHVDSSRIVTSQLFLAGDDVERRALLCRRVGHQQRALRKIKRGKANLLWNRDAAIAPAKPPGDHQMKNEKKVIARRRVLELPDDALAESAKSHDAFAEHGVEWRFDR